MSPAITSPERRHGEAYDWLSTAALISVTVVVGAGMSRLFTDRSFLSDVLTPAVVAHAAAAAARRARLPVHTAAVACCGSVAIAATLMLYSDTAWLVLPTVDTVVAMRGDLADSWSVVNASSAPVAPTPGLVLVAGAALAACAFLADTAAFRIRAAASAVVPASTVYGFTVAAGTGDGAVMHGALFSGAVGAAMVALWLRSRQTDAWIDARPGRGTLAMARTAGAALMLAVVSGAVAGPWLPGADAAPWVDLTELEVTDAAPWAVPPNPQPEPWSDFELRSAASGPASDAPDPDGPRVLVSPLVQVRSRLVDLSDRELFIVEVLEEERQYWRLTSLDEFDGNGWEARSDYSLASGPLAGTIDPETAGSAIVQTVTLTGLGNSYLPAAFEPRRILDDGGTAMEHEAASGSLIKARPTARDGSGSFTYSVESVVPSVGDPDRLRNAATSTVDPELLASNTELPDEARAVVLAEAQRVTADGRSDYHRALLLQDYFRLDGAFRYDLHTHSRGGIDSLEEFLFDVRAGYCQQFASAYAAMARSIGLPARVAVGFTWGEWDPARGERGAYVVRGEHAHAWPEVYFADAGWIRFEPTPGRGAPGDFAITGHFPEQSGPLPPTVQAAAQQNAAPSSGASDDSTGSGFAGLRNPPEQDSTHRSGTAQRTDGTGGSVLGMPHPLAAGAIALAAAASLLGAVPLLRRLNRRRVRVRLADDPPGLIEECWSDAVDALALAGINPNAFETPHELARRALARGGVGPVPELAALATHGRYAADTSASMAARAEALGSLVVAECRSGASRSSRLAAAIDPSTLFRGRANMGGDAARTDAAAARAERGRSDQQRL